MSTLTLDPVSGDAGGPGGPGDSTGTPQRPVPQRRSLTVRPSRSDRVFVVTVRSAAIGTLVIMVLIGTFLAIGAWPALEQQGWGFLTEHQWLPGVGATSHFGIASLLWGTVLVGLIALLIAIPVSFGSAVFISEYAPRPLRKVLITLVDLMAAVPAVVYAAWALFFLQARLLTVSQWLATHLGHVVPFLRVKEADTPSSFTSSIFIAGIAVGFVIMPTITSIMREVFMQAPVGEREGAIALGATRWGMIRSVVLPFGRAGIVGGIMLGLGRALGETIVVYVILSPSFDFTTRPLQTGGNTISPHIATRYSESSGVALSGLLAAGLLLFLFTLVINTAAGVVVSRSRSGADTEI